MRTVGCSARDMVGLAAAVVATGRSVRLRARGGSMAPTIFAGERLWVAPVQASALTAGDIVMVGGPRPVVHRVVRIDHRRGTLVTQGDAMSLEDEPVSISSVIGRVVRIDRRRPAARTRCALASSWRSLRAAGR